MSAISIPSQEMLANLRKALEFKLVNLDMVDLHWKALGSPPDDLLA